MSSKTIIIAAAAVAAVVLIGGGVAAYLVLAPGGTPAKIVEFIGQKRRLVADGDAVAAPQDGAERVARLPKDMAIDAVGVVEGERWVQVTLPDNRVAYVAASLLAAKAPDAPVPASPATLPVAAPSAPPVTPTSAETPVLPATPTVPRELEETGSVEFDAIASVYTAAKTVPVYIEPNVRAPQKYQIEPGTAVPAIQRSKDGVWVMASTEDGDPAYLLVADLGPEQPGKPTAAPGSAADQPDTVDGPATVITTSTLDVGGQPVTLAGISGESGAYAEQLQNVIAGQGGTLHCVRQDTGYLCKLANGLDVALSALFNGGARPTPDAPPAYQNQASAAQSAKRGIWQH
jgi:hypothetical protein